MAVTKVLGTVIITATPGSVTKVLGTVTINPPAAPAGSVTKALGTVHITPPPYYIKKVVSGVQTRPRIGLVRSGVIFWLTPSAAAPDTYTDIYQDRY